MNECILPLEILQRISEYMPNPFVMKLLCKYTRFRIRLYTLCKSELCELIDMRHLQYLRNLTISNLHDFDFSVFKHLKKLNITLCHNANISNCNLTEFSAEICDDLCGLDTQTQLKDLSMTCMNELEIDCTNLKRLYITYCNAVKIFTKTFAKLDYFDAWNKYPYIMIVTFNGDIQIKEICLRHVTIKHSFLMQCGVVRLDIKNTQYTALEILAIDSLNHIKTCNCSNGDYTYNHYIECYTDIIRRGLTTTVPLYDINSKPYYIEIDIEHLLEYIDDIIDVWTIEEIEKICEIEPEEYFYRKQKNSDNTILTSKSDARRILVDSDDEIVSESNVFDSDE